MEKFNLSKEAMQKLASIKESLNVSDSQSCNAYGDVRNCTGCWGGGCASGITG